MLPDSINISIIFYSTYGHTYQMAKAVAEGSNEIEQADVGLYQVPELMPEEALKESGGWEARKEFDHVPEATPEVLEESDGIIFGTPTRFGMMSAQMRNFLDQTGKQWFEGALIGKVGSVFASTGTQHGGQETTLRNFHTTLLHHGMVVVGVPYSEARLSEMDEITGGTPYGATTLAGDGSRQPSTNELEIARTQGRHVTKTSLKLGMEESVMAESKR